MSMIRNVNDVQCELPNDDNQVEKTNSSVVIHEPPPSYLQVNNPTNSDVHRYQTPAFSPTPHNGKRMPVVLVAPRMIATIPMMRPAVHVPDYTAWSIFNIVFCGVFFGAIALATSSKAKTRQLYGDIRGAREASHWAAGLNVMATITGIIGYTLITLVRVGYVSI